MSNFFQSLSEDGVNCEAKNAFCFDGKTMFVCLGTADFEWNVQSTALVEVDISQEVVKSRVLHTFTDGPIDYLAHGPESHDILVIGGSLHRVTGEGVQTLPAVCQPYMRKVLSVGDGRIIQIGDDGEAHFMDVNNQSQRQILPDECDLHDFDPNPSGHHLLGGTYGCVYEYNGAAWDQFDIPTNQHIKSIKRKTDGTLLLGGDDPWAMKIVNDEAVDLKGCESGINAITEFQGIEYWGDSEIGILARRGNKLVPAFETEFAFNLNTNNNWMTVNAGVAIYVTDGNNWSQFQVSLDPTALIQRVPLDFTPRQKL